jgi:hypothetical protein
MNEPQLVRLDLRTPLHYVEDQSLEPFEAGPAAGIETLFLFEIPSQGLNIEPDPELFLGPLLFSGRPAEAGESGPQRELPAGRYLFAQKPRFLNRAECIEMAISVQKDGLWERLRPGPLLYLRFLTEDGRQVSQVLRPYDG